MVTEISKDVRFALRQLFKNKGFMTVAVLTLALGIGANTAIFTLIHAIMFKSLPVSDPESLIRLGDGDNCCVLTGTKGRFSIYSYPLYIYLGTTRRNSRKWRRSRPASAKLACAARTTR